MGYPGECWSAKHCGLFCLACVSIVPYFILSLRMSYVDGSLERVAVYFWKDWSQDKPDVRYTNVELVLFFS